MTKSIYCSICISQGLDIQVVYDSSIQSVQDREIDESQGDDDR